MLNVLYEVNPLQSQKKVCKCKFRSLGARENSLAWISSSSVILSKAFLVWASSTEGIAGESTRLHALVLNTTSTEEPMQCPPVRKRMVERKAGSGAPGKLWRSSRGRDQRLPGDYWCMCISLELCCFPAQELSDRMHYPKQLWRAGLGLAISPSPTCLWKGSPASCCPALAPTSLAAFPMQ